MTYDFDAIIDRRTSDSIKWKWCEEDELPLWVADMDFCCPEPVIAALQERVAHGIFGYGSAPAELREVLVARLAALYDWNVVPEAIVFMPGVVVGFNLAAQALTRPGDGLLMQTPVYPPFLSTAEDAGLRHESMELTRLPDGSYEIDFDRFAAAFSQHTAMFLLCNPHNPVGRVFRQEELKRMASLCLEKRVLICSDEIHCDLIFSGYQHRPIAALDPEIAAHTVTLMAPSKTYNIPGLGCSFAVIPNPVLRERFKAGQRGVVGHGNLMGYTAALAAYRDGGPWLEKVLTYLEANRDFVVTFVRENLPGVRVASPEGTYLAWLDCRETGIPGNPYDFFRARARVMLNDGETFGPGGAGFVRLNFGTSRALLAQGLERMRAALATL